MCLCRDRGASQAGGLQSGLGDAETVALAAFDEQCCIELEAKMTRSRS